VGRGISRILAGIVFGANLTAQPVWAVARFIYLAQDGSSENRILRLDLEGGALETIQPSDLMGPIGVDVDLTAGKVYSADNNLGVIQRRNLDGTGGVETVIDTGIGPGDIALDPYHGKLYFADGGTPTLDATVKRADLNGSNIETLIDGTAPGYIALDLVHSKIYFTHGGSIFLSRADLDGSNEELLYAPQQDNLRGIALDVGSGKIYFGLRSQLDGSFRRVSLGCRPRAHERAGRQPAWMPARR
jgi:DNA-binding beta-propeller fold protein YncE